MKRFLLTAAAALLILFSAAGCAVSDAESGTGSSTQSKSDGTQYTATDAQSTTLPVTESTSDAPTTDSQTIAATGAVTDTTSPKSSEPATKTTTLQSLQTTVSVSETTLHTVSNDGDLRGIRIGLDPGHQRRANTEKENVAPNSSETKFKVSGGTAGVVTGILEYVTVLDISLMLRDKLVQQGAEVYLTRETHDVNISNQERAKMMNTLGVDVVLRIHCNGASNQAANGTALFVSKSNLIAAQSRRYAEIILPCITNAAGSKNNGIYQDDNYTGQNWSEVPCIMIECGYMSNPEEDVRLNSAAYQEKLTEGIVEGLIKCFAG